MGRFFFVITYEHNAGLFIRMSVENKKKCFALFLVNCFNIILFSLDDIALSNMPMGNETCLENCSQKGFECCLSFSCL